MRSSASRLRLMSRQSRRQSHALSLIGRKQIGKSSQPSYNAAHRACNSSRRAFSTVRHWQRPSLTVSRSGSRLRSSQLPRLRYQYYESQNDQNPGGAPNSQNNDGPYTYYFVGSGLAATPTTRLLGRLLVQSTSTRSERQKRQCGRISSARRLR